MRHRVEDLGKISVMLNNLLNRKLFKEWARSLLTCGDRSYSQWFFDQPREVQEDMVNDLQNVKEDIFDILDVADGVEFPSGFDLTPEVPDYFVD